VFNHIAKTGTPLLLTIALPFAQTDDAQGGLPLPPDDLGPAPTERRVTQRYVLAGSVIAADGTLRPGTTEAEITAICAGPWCGDLPRQGRARLFLLRGEGAGYVTEIGPCGGGIFPVPTSDQLSALKRCVAAGRCARTDLALLEMGWR